MTSLAFADDLPARAEYKPSSTNAWDIIRRHHTSNIMIFSLYFRLRTESHHSNAGSVSSVERLRRSNSHVESIVWTQSKQNNNILFSLHYYVLQNIVFSHRYDGIKKTNWWQKFKFITLIFIKIIDGFDDCLMWVTLGR